MNNDVALFLLELATAILLVFGKYIDIDVELDEIKRIEEERNNRP